MLNIFLTMTLYLEASGSQFPRGYSSLQLHFQLSCHCYQSQRNHLINLLPEKVYVMTQFFNDLEHSRQLSLTAFVILVGMKWIIKKPCWCIMTWVLIYSNVETESSLKLVLLFYVRGYFQKRLKTHIVYLESRLWSRVGARKFMVLQNNKWAL